MSQLTLGDLVRLILSAGPSPRGHSANFDLLKAIYDKEFTRLTLLFGLFGPLSIGVLTVLIKVVDEIATDGFSPQTTSFFILLLISVLAIGSVLWFLVSRTGELRSQFLSLIRLYLSLDRSLP